MGFQPLFKTKNTRKPSRIKGLRVFFTESQIAFTDAIYLVLNYVYEHKILW